MGNSNTQTVGNIITELKRLYGWNEQMDGRHALEIFENCLDLPTRREIKRTAIKNRILYVEMSSPAARQNLQYRLEEIKNVIHQKIGRNTIQDIILR